MIIRICPRGIIHHERLEHEAINLYQKPDSHKAPHHRPHVNRTSFCGTAPPFHTYIQIIIIIAVPIDKYIYIYDWSKPRQTSSMQIAFLYIQMWISSFVPSCSISCSNHFSFWWRWWCSTEGFKFNASEGRSYGIPSFPFYFPLSYAPLWASISIVAVAAAASRGASKLPAPRLLLSTGSFARRHYRRRCRRIVP